MWAGCGEAEVSQSNFGAVAVHTIVLAGSVTVTVFPAQVLTVQGHIGQGQDRLWEDSRLGSAFIREVA
jgi:hypothetical protein